MSRAQTKLAPLSDRAKRNDALALSAILLPELGEGWLLGDGATDAERVKFADLLLNLACIEVRLCMEDAPGSARDERAADVLPAACRIVETFIVWLVADDGSPAGGHGPTYGLPASAATTRLAALPAEVLLRWHTVLNNTFGAVTSFLLDWWQVGKRPWPP